MEYIKYYGINTNNLKNIDFFIEKNSISSLSGPNGSGKTSLAYDTIEKISKYEFNKLLGITDETNNYLIDSYENIIPTISLKQFNFNNNPRSTVATFTGIDHLFKILFANTFKINYSFFSFNNYKNSCTSCRGLGYILAADIDLIVDFKKSILEAPFKSWNNFTSNHYYPLLYKFCSDNEININIPLYELSKDKLDLIFFGKNNQKDIYEVKFKQKSYKTKKLLYVGVLQEIEDGIKSSQKSDNIRVKSYVKQMICPHCQGKRFSTSHESYKIENFSIGDFYMMELSELLIVLETLKNKSLYNNIVCKIYEHISNLIDTNLEYLNLNRSIPTLSGGELQRLRLVNILHSKISNILYILDEPTSSIHDREIDKMLEQLKKLNLNKNTLLIIEHNKKVIDFCDYNFFLGPKSGINGGYFIKPPEDSIPTREKKKDFNWFEIDELEHNNVKKQSVKLPLNSLIGIEGLSGSGKSSLAKAITNRIDNSIYISQKPINSNSFSIVATYIEIFDSLKNELSKYTKLGKDTFSFSNESTICENCLGKGYTLINIPFGDTFKCECDDCKGYKYNSDILTLKYEEFTIKEIIDMNIDDLLNNKIFINSKKITSTLNSLVEIGLGYLTLFQETPTLSGGEAQRLKIIKYLNKNNKDKLYIIDEAFNGVDLNNISKTLIFFEKIIAKNTIILVEHNKYVLDCCDYIIEIGPGKGKYGGKIIKQYLNS